MWFNIYRHCQRIRLPSQKFSTFPSRKDVTEIRIPVPWGYVAGKWWGDTSKQPILALHGWQDNAGTFDPLLDSLDSPLSVMAIDFPGHGFSSHYPEATIYHLHNAVMLLYSIKEYFGWTEKLTILGHSAGGATAFVFAALFPESVGLLVNLDIVKPYASTSRDFARLGARMDKLIVKSRRDRGDNPGYSLEELERRWIAGTRDSLTVDSVRVLLKRGAKMDPANWTYNFTRDPKLKIISLAHFNEDQCLEFARNIKCHYYVVKFTKSDIFDGALKHTPSFLQIVADSAKSFDVTEVEGTHHCHLNEPDKVAPLLKEIFHRHNIQ